MSYIPYNISPCILRVKLLTHLLRANISQKIKRVFCLNFEVNPNNKSSNSFQTYIIVHLTVLYWFLCKL